MKRGKDEEKMMGPMFPRLHVNDTEKGGPRAPPRNKMALYEQLSVPSQRFRNALLPCNPNNTNLVPMSSQAPPRHASDKQYSQYSDLSTPFAQTKQRKKLDEDDYRVPVFIQPMPSKEFDKYSKDTDQGKLRPSNPPYLNNSLKFQKAKNPNEESSEEFVAGGVKAISNSSSIEKTEGLKKQTVSSLSHEPGENPVNSIDRLETDDSLSAESQPSKNMATAAKRNSSNSEKHLPSEDQNIVHDLSTDSGSYEDGSCRSLQTGNLERADSLSETSVLDNVSGLEMTPDDVVGLIGQKRFWKARRAIANQQRVFAVQVFELHRLIKVQRLIAASPNLLLEDSAYLSKPLKPSPGKKLPSGYAVKPIPNISKQKGDSEKQSHKKEGSAENTIEKSPAENGPPPSSCQPSNSNSPAPSVVSADQNARPWPFNQLQGHQWLIPVMSPSEGLVYKPYPGPAFVGQACGGCGPPGMMTNISPPQYQLPCFPAIGPHSYFPPYGMPIMTTAAFPGLSVEQVNAKGTSGDSPAGEANLNIQNQKFFTKPSQENGTVPEILNKQATDDNDGLQASTGSSPSQKRQCIRASDDVEGRNMLPLFPTMSTEVPEPDRPTRVIKVVPHDGISASESAKRIFRSIQEERKRYDSV